MTKYEYSKIASKCENAVMYMIDVWDEVMPSWRESPDHVQKKFIDAENEVKECIKQYKPEQ